MTTVAITGLAGVEHRRDDGSFAPVQPGPLPTAIQAGDRLWVQVEPGAPVWLYAVSARGQAEYRKLGAWQPAGGSRLLWPGGRVLSDDDAAMTTLFVVASPDPLVWLDELSRADCTAVVGKLRPRPPVTACDRLYGLFWTVPGRVRGMVAPSIGHIDAGGSVVPAIRAAHRGAPYTAIEWQFQPAA